MTLASTYKNWLVECALPLWSTRGFDAGAGRFHERLDFSGEAVDVPYRVMVQARQIYVYAHAACLGWSDNGGKIAEVCMASLRRDFCEESADEASFAFSIGREGAVVANVRDAYAHAFVLFAISWLYRLNGDRALLQLADKTIRFIEARLIDPVNGGMFEAFPIGARAKRQNPHMHLLEAYLALARAAPDGAYLDRAVPIVTLFKERLFNRKPSVLLEHFSEDWLAHPDPILSRIFEPGHHFEWVWLLCEYEKLSGEDMSFWTHRLYEVARRRGVSQSGLIFDEIQTDMQVRRNSHRIWPHTEAIKAAKALQAGGDPEAPLFLQSMIQTLFDRFLDRPFRGGWIDQIDNAYQPLVDYVPASSLYHLFFAAAEAAS